MFSQLSLLTTRFSGGGRVKSPDGKSMVRAKDASDTAPNTRAVTAAFEQKKPVAVIAGKLSSEQSTFRDPDQAC